MTNVEVLDARPDPWAATVSMSAGRAHRAGVFRLIQPPGRRVLSVPVPTDRGGEGPVERSRTRTVEGPLVESYTAPSGVDPELSGSRSSASPSSGALWRAAEGNFPDPRAQCAIPGPRSRHADPHY